MSHEEGPFPISDPALTWDDAIAREADREQVKTWRDVQEAALHDPILFKAVTHVTQGDCSREEALIAAVLTLSRLRQELLDKEIERLMNVATRAL